MIIRNVLNPHFLNGKIFVVNNIARRLLFLSSIQDQRVRPETHALHRMYFKFDFSDLSGPKRQFPIRFTFYATVQKSQGQTLRCMVVDMRFNFFSPGNLYVALSRARKLIISSCSRWKNIFLFVLGSFTGCLFRSIIQYCESQLRSWKVITSKFHFNMF